MLRLLPWVLLISVPSALAAQAPFGGSEPPATKSRAEVQRPDPPGTRRTVSEGGGIMCRSLRDFLAQDSLQAVGDDAAWKRLVEGKWPDLAQVVCANVPKNKAVYVEALSPSLQRLVRTGWPVVQLRRPGETWSYFAYAGAIR
jgi:hypothetical protein